MKTHSKFLALVLSLALSLSLLPAAALADETADTTPAETQSETANTEGTGSETPAAEPTKVADAAELTAAVAAGGSIQLTADIEVDATLNIVKDTTIDTNGHTLTITPAAGKSGIIVNETATLTLTDTAGSGFLTIDGSKTPDGYKESDKLVTNRGINCFGSLTITGGTVNIQNTLG